MSENESLTAAMSKCDLAAAQIRIVQQVAGMLLVVAASILAAIGTATAFIILSLP